MTQLYSDLKILHFHSKLNDMSEGRVSAPIHVRLKPTNKCVHQCEYCCYRNSKLHLSQLFKETDEIPQSKMKEIVSDFGRMGVRAVTFSGGGEPLFYPYFVETVNGLAKLGIKIGVLTNGSLLKGPTAEALGKKASWVRISMDSVDPYEYARSRRTSVKEFGAICDNMQRFAGLKEAKCRVGVNFIVTWENYKDIYKFLALMKKIGINHVKISEAVVSAKRAQNKKHYMPIVGAVKKEISRGLADLADKKFFIIDKFDDYKDKDGSYEKGYRRCHFMQCLTVIGADMNVYTCQDKAYTTGGKLGSIKGESFRALWASEKTRRKILNLNPSRECLHHCTQHVKNEMLLDYFNIDQDHLDFV